MIARYALRVHVTRGYNLIMPGCASETRRRILANTYLLFYREGSQRSGLDAVAEAAGATKRTLYNHFPSIDALRRRRKKHAVERHLAAALTEAGKTRKAAGRAAVGRRQTSAS